MIKYYIIFLIAILFSCCKSEPEKIKFNKAQWLQGDWKTRGKMVNNIIDDSLLIGINKTQVIELLGTPTASDTIGHLSYVVDIGLTVGPIGMREVWLFYLGVQFDTTSNKVVFVRCSD